MRDSHLNPRADYSLVELERPDNEPVSLALVKNHLAVDHSDDDDAIQADISAARSLCEKHCNRLFGTRSLRLTLDCWPLESRIAFPVDGVQSITSVTYSDVNGAPQVVASTNWRLWLEHSPPLLSFVSGFAYPTLELDAPGAIAIVFVAGDDDPNELVAAAIKLTIGYWRKFFGGEDSSGHLSRGLPAGAIHILDKLWTGAL